MHYRRSNFVNISDEYFLCLSRIKFVAVFDLVGRRRDRGVWISYREGNSFMGIKGNIHTYFFSLSLAAPNPHIF